MGIEDKIKHGAEELAGKEKKAVGTATGNDDLVAEGKAEEAKANLKQAGDNIKDAFNNK